MVVHMRNFEVLWDLPYRKENSNAKKLGRESCCSYWNLGLDCGPFLRFSGKACVKHHICSHDDCRELTDTTHRALQHRPIALCLGHSGKGIGMNKMHPTPLRFHKDSSAEDTLLACKRYNVKPPTLNWQLLQVLLEATEMPIDLRTSLVRGWREGLDLGSTIPDVDHLVDSPTMEEEQLKVLRYSLKEETERRRLCGPLSTPIRDGRWFTNA